MVSVVKGTTKAEAKVLNNPVTGSELTLVIRCSQGEWLQVTLIDEQGKIISEKIIQEVGITESVRLNVSNSAATMLFVRVSTLKESKTVKVMRIK